MTANFQDKVGFLWSVADLLRGDYKQSEYGKVILPLTVLRRLDSVLEKTKPDVLAKASSLLPQVDETMRDVMLRKAAGGVGLPRISDGSLLFLQHMVSKFKKDGQGSRLAIVFNGGAGSGESEIRRWLIENDWLEAIVALPPDLFYNTGISTYIWIVTNRKSDRRKGKIQLIDASSFFIKMRKSLGNKRNEISREQIAEIACTYGNFREGSHCKIFRNEDFGYWRVTVERPLRLNFAASPERLARIKDEVVRAKLTPALVGLTAPVKNRDTFTTQLKAALKTAGVTLTPAALKSVLAALGERDAAADICTDRHGQPEADPELRDFENVPLAEKIEDYFAREVKPHAPDAWIDHDKTKKGYEIPFTRHFYQYTPLRPLALQRLLQFMPPLLVRLPRHRVASLMIPNHLPHLLPSRHTPTPNQ